MKKAILYLLASVAFNNPAWKLDDKGAVVLKDGNPVYVDASGKEMTVDHTTISRLNGEAKGHREAKETAEAALKKFDGLDPDLARKSIETVSKLDAKKLIDSGEVDTLTKQIKDQFTGQLSEKDKSINTLQSQLDNMHIDRVFDGSEWLRNNIAVPRDLFQASFRNNFKVEKGEVVAYDKVGNRLLSKSKAGEYATPEEALQLLVEQHPQKEMILKAQTGNGTGSNGNGGNRGNGKVVKRDDFAKLPPAEQANVSAKVRAGEMTLTD